MHGDDEEEVDYMSDALLAGLQQEDQKAKKAKRSARAGGDHIRAALAIRKGQKGPRVQKSKKVLEQEQRERGLKQAIGSESKGFRLMQKMGYSAGQGLGKQEQGMADPLTVSVKRGREGLGVHEEARRKRIKRKEDLARVDEMHHDVFAARQRDRFYRRKVSGQLRSGISVCSQMDEEKGITRNALLARICGRELSPLRPNSQEEGRGGSTTSADGVEWQDVERETGESAMAEADQAHANQIDDKPEQSEMRHFVAESVRSASAVTISLLMDMQVADMERDLMFLLDYLRIVHLYCLYCGVVFDSAAEMEAQCPGTFETDHE